MNNRILIVHAGMTHQCVKLALMAALHEPTPMVVVDVPQAITNWDVAEFVKAQRQVESCDLEPEPEHITPWLRHPPPIVHQPIREEPGGYG